VLAIAARVDPKGAFSADLGRFDWDEVDVTRFEAVDAEVVNLSQVVALSNLWIGMVSVRTAGSEANCSGLKPSRLALHTSKPVAFVNHDVVPQVLAERHEHGITSAIESDDDRKLGPLANAFWMFHSLSVPKPSAGPCPNQTTRALPTM
jgi:hypothetical protein